MLSLVHLHSATPLCTKIKSWCYGTHTQEVLTKPPELHPPLVYQRLSLAVLCVQQIMLYVEELTDSHMRTDTGH